MPTGYQALTEKEKETLRLIVRGHDAKSMARSLGLSVHTINERLREARRKLRVSSSREAARLVFEAESLTPQIDVDSNLGAAQRPIALAHRTAVGSGQDRPRAARLIAGASAMSIFIAFLAISSFGTQQAAGPASAPTSSAVASESDAVRSARDWLVLGDQQRWQEGWQGTASTFRKLNSAAQWAAAAQKVRVPLGAVVTRIVLGEESVPAPPAGVQVEGKH
jgi:DNA-binding CsgD family transcriptional regulator